MEFIHSNYANSLTKQVEEVVKNDEEKISEGKEQNISQDYAILKNVMSKLLDASAQNGVDDTVEFLRYAIKGLIEGGYLIQPTDTPNTSHDTLNRDFSDNEKAEESKIEANIETATEHEDNDIVVESKPIYTVPAPVTDPIALTPTPKKEEEFKLDNKKMWDIVYPSEGDNSDNKFDIINLNKIIGLSYHEGLCTIYTMGSTVARACTYKEYQDFAKSVNYVVKGDADYLNYTFENYYAGESDTIKCEYYFIFDEIIYASDIRYDNSATIQLGPHIITIPNIEVPDDELSEYDLFRNRIKFYWRARLAQNKSDK